MTLSLFGISTLCEVSIRCFAIDDAESLPSASMSTRTVDNCFSNHLDICSLVKACIIKSFQGCYISNAMDGSEDDMLWEESTDCHNIASADDYLEADDHSEHPDDDLYYANDVYDDVEPLLETSEVEEDFFGLINSCCKPIIAVHNNFARYAGVVSKWRPIALCTTIKNEIRIFVSLYNALQDFGFSGLVKKTHHVGDNT